MFALTRGVRGPRREPRRGLLGCGFTSVGFGGLGGLGRLGLGAWGAWALGRLGDLGAWALGGLGEDEPPGAGFPGVGLHRRRLHGGSFQRASRGLSGGLPAGFTGAFRRASRGLPGGFPAGFRRASGGLPAGFTGLSLGAFPGAFPGLFRGLRRAFPAGFPGGLSRGFSGGLFRRAFPADARLGRADSSFLNSPPCAGATKRRRVLLRGGESDFGVPA